MWGPVYHGTTQENRARIEKEGFKIFHGSERSGNISHGYENRPYHENIPPPVHHLGYGVYFTTSPAIAKQFSGGTMRNMPTYYLATKNVGEINFGAANTMMKWWVKNGYDPKVAQVDRVTATRLLTDRLKKQYHAVWFKGKGLYRLLDGDQVCVYYPEIIYQIDKTLSKYGEVGSKVVRKADGMKGILLERKVIDQQYRQYHRGETEFLTVKWQKGGVQYNVYLSQVQFV
jgi:hypothetical protein